MPDPNPNPNPDPNPAPPVDLGDPDDTDTPAPDPDETETEQQPGRFAQAWCWARGHKAVTALIVILALFAVDHLVLHNRISIKADAIRDIKNDLYGRLWPRVDEAEQAVTKKDTGILAQLDQIHTKNREQDSRLDKVETKVGDLGSKLDKSTALLLSAIKGLGGEVEESSADEADTEEPTAEPEEPVAQAPATPKVHAKAPAAGAPSAPKATKPARKTARVEPEPSEAPAPVVRAPSAPAKPVKRVAAAPARRGAANPDEFLDAAERIHADAELLVEGALEGRETTPEQDERIEEHRRRYQPAAIRPTAWRDVRTDETKVVFAGR